jgi:trigger factor
LKSKIRSKAECRAEFDVEVPKETIDKAFEEAYAGIAKVASVPGFRAGKAPIDLIRKRYAKEASKDVLDRIVSEAYSASLEEHGIDPVGYPEISDLVFAEGKTMSFKAKVDTRPKFNLKDYKGMHVEKKKPRVTDEDVKKAIDSLREYAAKYIPVEDRAAAWGDYVVSDLECFVDGKEAHKKRENLWLFLDKESLLGGLMEKIIGMRKGEERDVEVELPEKYPDKNIAGRRAKYRVKVSQIKSRKIPDVNDEFAKDLGKENLDSLKKMIVEELEKKAAYDSEIAAENQLLDKLIDENDFAVPQTLVAKQIRLMTENAKNKLAQKGFTREELDKKDDEFSGRFKADATRHVKLLFILDSIASEQKISADAEDLANAYKSIAAETQKREEEVKNYYEKEGLEGSLLQKIREEKTIEFLLKNAKITDKE